jgi:hypothetical protein
MSSVTSFLRQIPTGLQYYTVSAADASNAAYQFVPGTGNYVGNYTPGAMVQSAVTFNPATQILRDMGKTIKASVATSVGNAQAGVVTAASEAFFREFQVLTPVAGPQTNFGVIGGPSTPSAYAPYFTIYFQTTVSAVGLTPASLMPVAGGQL